VTLQTLVADPVEVQEQVGVRRMPFLQAHWEDASWQPCCILAALDMLLRTEQSVAAGMKGGMRKERLKKQGAIDYCLAAAVAAVVGTLGWYLKLAKTFPFI
jgi:hypothetical protein